MATISLENNNTFPRWRILIASVFIMLCTGTIYAFSVFAGPLATTKGWTMEEVMLAFTINAAIAPIPMIAGGKWVDNGGAKWALMSGGILFGLGFIFTAMSTTTTMLYISYGLLSGTGQSLAYSGALGNTVRLFPDKRGLALGIITAAYGGAAIIVAPLASFLIESQGITATMSSLGIAFVIICVIGGLLIKPAPTGYVPEGWTPPKTSGNKPSAVNQDVPWTGMIKSYKFYIILAMFSIGPLSGLMIASNASIIGQSMIGLSAATAAIFVSIYSLSNCLGRIIWGAISDKIGRYRALMGIFGVISVMLFIMATMQNVIGFAISIIGIGICFGGTMGVFPSIVTENFGAKFYGVNYGIVFTGYAAAAFFGPKIAASIAQANNGDFTLAFYIAMVCSLIGLGLTLLFVSLNQKKKQEVAEKVAM